MVRLTSFVGGALALLAVLSASGAAPSTTTTPPKTPTSSINFILPSAPATPTPTTQQPNNATRTCPGPLIPNLDGVPRVSCMSGCCLKCPMIDNFYEPNQVQDVLTAAYITRQVSLGLSVFMAISYLVLPGKRAQPHISVLFLTVSTSLWYAAFNVMPGVSNACANDYEYSKSSNSRLCGIQGVLIIYLTQTSALWCSLLIYKLHLLAVWRSNWIDAYYGWFTGLCWILPLGFAIPVAVKGLSEYPGVGFSCLVNKENLNTYLFYPTAVYMYPAMLCHVVTVAKMIRLAMLSSKIDTGLSQLSADARNRITTTMHAKRLLRGQWRPALMLLTVMASLTVFWLFYFVDAHRVADLSPTTPWLGAWMYCVYSNGPKMSASEVQTLCAKAAKPNLPSIAWFTAAEMLLAIIGVVIALVFISKSEFWEEWAYLLTNLFTRGKTGSGSSRGRSSPHEDDDDDAPPPKSFAANHQGEDHKVHGATPGLYRSNSNSKASYHEEPLHASQWYSMDDLLDKEYDDHGNRISNLQRNTSFGSRTGMATSLSPNPMSDPPRYNNGTHVSNDLNGGEFYRNDNAPSHWPSSANTIVAPSKVYMTNDQDRYMEQPVVPNPVPRTPKMGNEPIYLSNPSNTSGSISGVPAYGGGHGGGSLSPMPPRSPPTNAARTRQQAMDSVPIIAVATRGTPSQAHYSQASSPPSSPLSRKQRAALFNSGESDQIMMASRENYNYPGAGNSQQQMMINVALANGGMDQQRTRSPMPPVPMKSPHRQPLSPTS
ncbi:hypothetical protein BGX34_011633 [Mortierella sp. NVP85]|nr:hypothetical protein BGX34_011633 [Mortierella sp. NVP85]